MITKVERKVYDSEGTETSALGLPCKTVIDYWNGNIDSGGVHIDDAFDIDEVNISDDHSTGLMALVGEIAKVQQQERCIPTDIETPVIKGLPFKEDGETCDWDADEVEATVEEIELTEPIYVEGIPVKHLWKAFGVSYTENSSNVLMDGRTSMAGYSVDNASNLVYKVLPNNDTINALLGISESRDDNSVDVEGGNFEEQVSEKGYYILGLMSKINIDNLLGIAGVCVGINGDIPSWMLAINSCGVPLENIINTLKEDAELKTYAIPNHDNLVYIDSESMTNPQNALDGNNSTFAYSTTLPHSLTISYGEHLSFINQVSVSTGYTSSGDRITAFEIYGSLDNNTWEKLFFTRNVVYGTNIFSFSNIKAYRYYKYVVNESYGGWHRTENLDFALVKI